MEGFYTSYGYMGKVEDGHYVLFATVDEYLEYLDSLSDDAVSDNSSNEHKIGR